MIFNYKFTLTFLAKMKNLFVGTLMSTCFLACACTTSSPFDKPNFSVDLGYGVKMDFISVPAGTFTMGRLTDNKVKVELSPFALGKTEVTQEQWLVVMGNNPSRYQGENLPVESVSWSDAMKFCKKLTDREHNTGRLPRNLKFTLPSEAQWEYACRAGTKTLYSFGDNASLFPLYANFPDKSLYCKQPKLEDTFRVIDTQGTDTHTLNDGFEKTAPVGRFRPNTWGFYDMHGNVSEWCLDYHNVRVAGGKNPIRTTPGNEVHGGKRTTRGGSWLIADFYAWVLHAFPLDEWDLNMVTGFRVALVQSSNP